jgi:hypothetical protein
VVDQDGDSWPALDSGVLSVTAKILLWLWDLERKHSDTSNNENDDSHSHSRTPTNKDAPPVILLVTANDHYAPLLTTLKQRG